MKIETSTTLRKSFLERLASSKWKKVIVFLVLNNLLIVLIGLVGFLLFVPQNYKAKVYEKISIAKFFERKKNQLEGLQSKTEEFQIDIKHKNLQKLAYFRSISLDRGLLYSTEENDVPATIRHNGTPYRVKLSLKGRLSDHWSDKNIWSLKVKVKGENTILGMKYFALQHPRTRNYLNDWIIHKLYGDMGLIALRYDYISVNINGTGDRIYALEEHLGKRLIENNNYREGPILKFNHDFYWENGDGGYQNRFGLAQDLWGSNISPQFNSQTIADSVAFIQFDKAKSLFEGFRQDRFSTSEVFDIDKLALYFALSEFFGYHHSTALINIRFYYNPVTSRLEPIIKDNTLILPLEFGLLGEEKLIGKDIEHRPPTRLDWAKLNAWYELVFKDPTFFKAYIKTLEEISSETFLDEFFLRHEEELLSKKKILNRDYPDVEFETAKGIMYENQAYIRNALKPEKLIHAYLESKPGADRTFDLNISNIHSLPVEISNISIGDSIQLKSPNPINIIQPTIDYTPSSVQKITVEWPREIAWHDSLISHLVVESNILGAAKTTTTSVLPWPLINEELLVDDLIRQAPNAKSFGFLQFDEAEKRITLKKGVHRVENSLIIPKGYEVFASAGTVVDLSNKANIISYSPLHMVGTDEEPVVFQSSDSTSQGIVVLNCSEESYFQFVQFDNLANTNNKGWSLPAAVTFYQSPVKFDNCLFSNNRIGDDCLNVIKTDFQINNSFFINTNADAFDGDFCKGSMQNVQFQNVGNDGIDVSGSRITLNEISMRGVGDKGLSVGEKSTVNGDNFYIYDAEIAVASKDFSTATIGKIKIENSRIAYCAFQKKSEFGPAEINITQQSDLAGEIEIECLIEEGCSLYILEEKQNACLEEDHVKEVLYGVKYGKK